MYRDFVWNTFYSYLVNEFTMGRDFLLFSPYLCTGTVTRVSWLSFPFICLLP